MKEYDERTLKIAERVFEKGDRIIAQHQKKTAKLRHISYGVSGTCAALTVCAGVFYLSSSMKMPSESFKSSEQIPAAETTTKIVTTAVTAAVSSHTATSHTITTASASTIASTGNTATEKTTEIMTDTPFTETEEEIPDTQPVTDDLQTVEVTTAVTTIQSEGLINDFPIYTTSASSRYVFIPSNTMLGGYISAVMTELEDVFRSHGASVTMENDASTVYEKQDELIPIEKIDGYIGTFTVTIRLSGSKTVSDDMQVYSIKDISQEEAVAVRLTDTYEFYLFAAPTYKAEDGASSE